MENIGYQFVNITAKLGTISQTVAQEQACEWWLPFPLGLWLVALISWRLLGTLELCMPSAKNDTRTMASDLQMPWQNLAHLCCAKCCLFLISPSLALGAVRTVAGPSGT